MFRGTKRKRAAADDVRALYRGILRRTPSDTEVEALSLAIAEAGSIQGAIDDMMSSHEFGVMVLPNLVNEYVTKAPESPLFFLHVPKTAGTSFRESLMRTMGVPAFHLYTHSSWGGYGKTGTMNFWPLWAGHAAISVFPETHRGITVFRESRSRVLSAYRQQERESARENYSLTRFSRDDTLMQTSQGVVTAADPFGVWVKYVNGATQWYIEAPTDERHRLWDGRPRSSVVKSMSEHELVDMLTRTLGRLDAAAWAHDSVAMEKSIEVVTGAGSAARLGNENLFATEPSTKPTILSPQDLDHLNRVAQSEKILFELAVDKGLIPPLDPDCADEEFERTALRLGFSFA